MKEFDIKILQMKGQNPGNKILLPRGLTALSTKDQTLDILKTKL